MSNLNSINKEDANKAVVEKFYTDVFINRDVESGNKYIHLDYVNRNEFVPDGNEGFCQYFEKYFRMFPKTKAEIEIISSKNDLVFVHAFHNASNAVFSVKFKVIDIYRVQEGILVEHWDCIEGLNFLSKLMFTFKALLRL